VDFTFHLAGNVFAAATNIQCRYGGNQAQRRKLEMKKSFLLVSMMLVVATSLTGCATSRDLAKVQAQEQVIDAKGRESQMKWRQGLTRLSRNR